MPDKSNENPSRRSSPTMRDINRVVTTGPDIVLMSDQTVATLEEYKTTIQSEQPTRVPGLTRPVDVEVTRYRINGRYRSVNDIEIASRPWQAADKGYRIEHVPENIRELYDAWAEKAEEIDKDAIIAAAEAIVATTGDRYQATVPCPDCPEDTKYACRRSGFSRQFYRYPLITVEDTADGQQYDVPFDAALYLVTQPECLEIDITQKIDQSIGGELSGTQHVGLLGNSLSRQYIETATNGLVIPTSDRLSFVGKQFTPMASKVLIDMWTEPSDRRPQTKPFDPASPKQIVGWLQREIMESYGERVDNADYESMLTRVQNELGKRGLNLLFGTRYAGMGETDWWIGAYDGARQTKYSIWSSIDSYEVLSEFDKRNAADKAKLLAASQSV